MEKLIGFWKPAVILLVSLGLAGFLYCGDDDDDKSCGDAVTNAVNVFINAYNQEELTLQQLCDEFQEDMTQAQYDQCIIATEEDLETLRSEIINALTQECAEDAWPQSLIDCLAGASTISAIEACIEAVED